MDGHPRIRHLEQGIEVITDLPPPPGSKTNDANPASSVHGKRNGM